MQTASILIIAGKSECGLYTPEILKTEGFNEFIVRAPDDPFLTKKYLRGFDVILATGGGKTGELEDILSGYVSAGGKLILFRPDKAFIKMSGLTEAGMIVKEGYFKIVPGTDIAQGMVTEAIQFHGTADGYTLNGAEELARLYSPEEEDTGFPAITRHHYGKGEVIGFMFSLPQSIVYLHQGNPEWKNQERDGVLGLRNLDLFAGTGSEKNWINKNKVSIPQADEQARLLSRIIITLTADRKPLPRLWYFSGLDKCVALLTCDGENNGDPSYYEKEIQSELDLVNSNSGHMTVYLIGTGIQPGVVNQWKNRGNEISIHYDDSKNAAHVTRQNMDSVITIMQNHFVSAYGHDFPLVTARNHWIVWYGWADQAAIEREHGIRLDCNSYKYDNSRDALRPDWIGSFGYYTGSGIPMKFADENGNILDIYQSETAIVDEQLNTKGGIYNGYKTLVDWSLHNEKYAVVNAVFHPNSNANQPYLEDLNKTVEYCRNNKVPMWSAEELLRFLQARDSVRFTDLNWSGSELQFTILTPVDPGKDLTFFLPNRFEGKIASSVHIDKDTVSYTHQTLKGFEYIMVPFHAGNDLQVSVVYQ